MSGSTRSGEAWTDSLTLELLWRSYRLGLSRSHHVECNVDDHVFLAADEAATPALHEDVADVHPAAVETVRQARLGI